MINLTSFQVHFLQKITTHLKLGHVGLIYLDIEGLELIEAKNGRSYTEQLIFACLTAIDELRPFHPAVFEAKAVGDDFFLYVSCPHGSTEEISTVLASLGDAFRTGVEERLGKRCPDAPPIELGFGFALLRESEEKELETLLYTAMKQAIRHAKERSVHRGMDERLVEFESILNQGLVVPHYQPIVSLSDGAVFGYEALTRGPEGSALRSPLELFRLAEESGKLYAFDKMTRDRAIAHCRGLGRQQRLFLNIPAHILHDPDFSGGRTIALLEQQGLSPKNVVFEITERSSIEDFSTARRVIAHYRSQGYRIAIDDAGAGYSSLQAIAEIEPDYIKVDRSLIKDIHKEKVKEYILETFMTFSKRLNVKVIAEGIESAEELDKLISLGVHYAQGFFLGKPQQSLEAAAPEARNQIVVSGTRLSLSGAKRTIGEIVAPAKTFPLSATVADAATMFRDHEELFGAVLVDGERPVGLVMREELFRKLAVQYGISLFWNKPLSVFTDERSLIVEAGTPLETVSQLAMNREANKLYDMVIVTEQGKLVGVATVRDILDHMTNIRMEHARVANPLTGLPGNMSIQRELQKRIMTGERFSVIYADLDYFKWFNDSYGFGRGDEVIQFTADAIRQATSVCGEPFDFVGHIGGDDFIAITGGAEPERLCEEIIRRFHAGIRLYYEGQMKLDFVEDRSGRRVESEGLSLSLSLVRIEDPARVSADAISQAAAACKKRAKAQRGSAVATAELPTATSSGFAAPQAVSEGMEF
ncbi:GGDEF domain-containing protein [Paenibacillus sp. TRM 82003]|nr:GGDEF domain-containing protein [Paenibacillus sp. TRM 82003]